MLTSTPVTLVHGRHDIGVIVGAYPCQVRCDGDDGAAGAEGEGGEALAGQEAGLGRPWGIAGRSGGGEDSPRPDIKPGKKIVQSP